MIETGPAPPAAGRAEPWRLAAEAFARIRRRLTSSRRRVTDGAVRLPAVMTFVVAMFAATVALVSFGYVATREWRSGTNLLLEHEALALVRAALSADLKGAWITAIAPSNTTVLDEEPPYGFFQVAARVFARFPYRESFVLWKGAARGDGMTYAFNRADRPPHWNTRPSSDDPFPVLLVRALVLTVRADRASVALASMKSDFVAAVTHELKTPVALIRLVGDTLANGRYTSPKTVQEYAGLLSVEASRLGNSIDNLLTYARYSGGRAADSTELVDVEPADLVEDALQGFRPTLATLEFELTVDLPPDLPRVSVDRPAVIQALENIIDNAIKYSGSTRRLAVSARAVGKSLTLTVKDSGSGIGREDQARIFERFYRGRNVSTSGSGLGLPIAKRIVESHGGRIDVRSDVGVGTEVVVTLPTSGRRHTSEGRRAAGTSAA